MTKPAMKQIDDETWEIAFNQPEAKGVIRLTAGAYGLDIKVDGVTLGLVDLFGMSSVGDETANYKLPQFVIDDGDSGNDSIGFIRMHPGGALVCISDSAEEINRRVFGYTSNPGEE